MHYDYETIKDLADAEPALHVVMPGDTLEMVVTVELERGDTSWNPVSARYDLFGPGTVTYTFHADGGVNTTITRTVRVAR